MAQGNPTRESGSGAREGGFVDTIQSLIVAFVLAMMFRGFVVEGFVIPTGSMAPTLLGEHWLVRSVQTGTEVPVGLDGSGRGRPEPGRLEDHALGRGQPLDGAGVLRRRLGDRILVCKYIWPFFQPDRFDISVFKNPTLPDGPSANYIKRVIGLPNETLWIVDGDIFVKGPGDDQFIVQRKPEHVQRESWQEVWTSTSLPVTPERRTRRWSGPPWVGTPSGEWEISPHGSWTKSGSGKAVLTWDGNRYPIDDWSDYNMISPSGQRGLTPVRDIRVAFTMKPREDGYTTSLQLKADSHVFEFTIDEGNASVSMWPTGDPSKAERRASDINSMHAGHASAIVFQRMDQSMSISINGKEIVGLDWNWTPVERLANVGGKGSESTSTRVLLDAASRPAPPELTWTFDGSPIHLSRIQVDRDLFYQRPVLSQRSMKNAPVAGQEALVQPGSPGFGTHPDKLAVLGPGEYFVLGDNTARSLDSRLWGPPSPMVATQLNPNPFVVDQRLLIGKAWLVYFPAPHSARKGGMGLIPDFGRMRFIR